MHGRRRLGHRPLATSSTARSRTARRRVMFEGVPTWPDRGPLLGRRRPPRRHDLLHRADGDPRAAGGGRRAGEEAEPQVAPAARLRRRADQSRGLALVLARGRRRALPDRRHVVADRDRRDPDLAPSRRDAAQAGLGDAAAARRPARRSLDDQGKVLEGERGRGQPRASRSRGPG